MEKQQVVEALGQMTVFELIALTKELEEKWGVKAAPITTFTPVPDVGPGDINRVEPTEFSVVLSEAGSRKLDVIRAVRDLTGYGLKEAKDLVDNAPRHVKDGVSKSEADDVKRMLEAAGAKVELVPS